MVGVVKSLLAYIKDEESGDGYRPCDPSIFDKKKKRKKFKLYFYFIFGHQNPGSRSEFT
jgi:hypothetical protein